MQDEKDKPLSLPAPEDPQEAPQSKVQSLPPPQPPKKQKQPGPQRSFLAPMPGFVWNPLVQLPRNRPCPCLSGLKFKACCLPRLPKVVLQKDADAFKEQMAKPDLVFMTAENKERIEAMAALAEQEQPKEETNG